MAFPAGRVVSFAASYRSRPTENGLEHPADLLGHDWLGQPDPAEHLYDFKPLIAKTRWPRPVRHSMRCYRVATPERWCWRPNQTGSHQSLARLCQFRAECWVGDLDQRAGAFGDRATAHLGNAVLGNDEVGLSARRGDDAIR